MSIEPQGSYLHVKIEGVIDNTRFKECFRQVYEVCSEKRLEKVLIDLRTAEGHITIMERYKYAKYLVKLQRQLNRNHGLMVKPVFVGFEPLLDRDRFGLMVGLNRGGVGLVTEDIDEAMEWLEVVPADKVTE